MENDRSISLTIPDMGGFHPASDSEYVGYSVKDRDAHHNKIHSPSKSETGSDDLRFNIDCKKSQHSNNNKI